MSATRPSWDSEEIPFETGLTADEPMGSKDKFWIEDTRDHSSWLFKYARVADGVVRNEDWAEWLVHQLACLLGIPTAVIRPATCGGKRGILSRSVLADTNIERLVHGNELLREANPSYDLSVKRQNPGYTIEAVHNALRGVLCPPSFDLPEADGFDTFGSYLLLDALVSGRDRHHENWAVVDRQGSRTMSPSFDHGNALGFQVSEGKAAALADDDARLKTWLDRGKSHHFAGKPHLVQLAVDALAASQQCFGAYWREKLYSLDLELVNSIVHAVDRELMSEASRRFVISLLEANRRRLLDALE